MDSIANLLLSPATATLAQIMTALVAALALVYARAQILSARATQRESTAKELYSDYLSLALANPSLANPDLSAFDYVRLTLNGSREKFEQYDWFVASAFFCFEEIHRLFPDDAEWLLAIRSQVAYHKTFVLSEYFETRHYMEYFDPEFRKLVEAEVGEKFLNGQDQSRLSAVGGSGQAK